jgi:hypothetical protein
VVGSGGTVGATNSNSIKMSGLTGQVAIEKRVGTEPLINGKTVDLYQGFWVPVGDYLSDVNDNTSSNSDKISNFPNPFSTTTTIKYSIPSSGKVTIRVFDMLGNQVISLVNEMQSSGEHSIVWNGKNISGVDVPSGSYYYELNLSGSQIGNDLNTTVYRNNMIVVR